MQLIEHRRESLTPVENLQLRLLLRDINRTWWSLSLLERESILDRVQAHAQCSTERPKSVEETRKELFG